MVEGKEMSVETEEMWENRNSLHIVVINNINQVETMMQQ